MNSPDLDPLFDPDAVAVVGASPDSWYSSRLVENLRSYGYDGTLYLVNPARDEAWGRPCHDSVADLPETVDLVVVSVPREHVVGVVREAGERGVPAALVITAGFGEADETGADLQAELATVAERHGVRVCGPNCIGLANARAGTVLTSTCSRQPEPGGIGLASHSGALAFTTFFERAADEDVDFAYLVSTGNEADLTLADYVAYMADDPAVDVVCAYVEGLEEPRRFLRIASEAVASGTPVLAVKIGRSEVARAAAQSHTGSLTGSDDVWDDALRSAGVERVPDIPDLLGRASAHAAFDPPSSRRVCVASTSGGLATLLADLADDRGLSLPSLAPETEDELLDVDELLTFGELHNPVDVRGYGADALTEIATHLFADDRFDAYLFGVALSAVDEDASDIADHLLRVAELADDPVVFLWTGRKDPADLADPQPYERVREVVPLFYDPGRAVDALASLVEYGEARDRLAARPSVEAGARAGPSLPDRGTLPWADATALLSAYGIDAVETRPSASPAEASEHAADLGFPVAMKVDSPDISHRDRIGAVRTGVESADEARRAYGEILDAVHEWDPDAAVEGVLIQPQVDDGVEAILGASRDPDFGPVVTLGTGGTLVEAVDDTTHLLAPFTEEEARDALERTALPSLLADDLGTTAPLAELATLATAVGRLIATREDVAELDLNPVVLTRERVVPVDALVRTR